MQLNFTCHKFQTVTGHIYITDRKKPEILNAQVFQHRAEKKICIK